MSSQNIELGEIIKFFMDERKITLKELALKIGLSEYKLRKIIKGNIKTTTKKEVKLICDYFALPYNALFDPDSGICEDNAKIIRYLDFAKFTHLLYTSKLYFSRGDEFEDAFEGKIPEVFFSNMANDFKEQYIKSYEKSKRNTYISCWSMAKTESYALWKIFAPNYGIAIQTTAGKLFKVIEPVNGMVYKVKYIDYSDIELKIPIYKNIVQKTITHNFFSLKSNVYKYEEEVRAIYTSEYPVNIQINDLNDFIEYIYVSPTSELWFFDLVKDIVKNKYRLNTNISLSQINLR